MKQVNYKIQLKTPKALTLIDITDRAEKEVKKAGVQSGFINIFSKHTTCAIRINENEPLLMKDFEDFLEKIASREAKYHHDDFEIRECPLDERVNGHSHIKSLILGASETVPIINGKLQLGKWQSIFFIELDGSREREVVFNIIGK